MSDSVEIADYILVLGGETRTPIGQSIIGKGGMPFPDWFASGFVTSRLKDQRSARVSGVPRKEKKSLHAYGIRKRGVTLKKKIAIWQNLPLDKRKS